MPQRRIRIQVRRRVTVRVEQRVQRTVRLQPAPIARPSPTGTPPPKPQVAAASRPQLRAGRSPVAEVGDNLRDVIGDDPREFDVFISHASPDKDGVVRPLAEALRDGGLSVWYDEFELRVGDSLRRRIDQGIRKARYGIVVLSPAFLGGRPWTEHELDGIVNAYIYNRQVLLPIWHQVDREDVLNYSPSLADKVALSTSSMSVLEIAEELIQYIAETREA